jgi:nucleotide-binding universal stress UspA family protein
MSGRRHNPPRPATPESEINVIALKNIIVGTDFGEAASTALDYGRKFARTFAARLHVVHVVEDINMNATIAMATAPIDLRAVQAQFEDDARHALTALIRADDERPLDIRPLVIRHHDPARALLEVARETAADLLIIGTHGRGGLAEFFLGSVAQHVVRTSPCPVLTVRAEQRDFIAPDAPASRGTSQDLPSRPPQG